MAYRFIRKNQGRYTVREMAEIFGVRCSASYRWAKYGVSPRRSEVDAEVAGLIRPIQEKHHIGTAVPG
jgi:hypothetical protein